MKLLELITYLKNIYKKYGDMDIHGNIIGSDIMRFSSICLVDNLAYISDNEDRYELLLEFDEYSKDKSKFNIYEYPSMKTISGVYQFSDTEDLENYIKQLNVNI